MPSVLADFTAHVTVETSDWDGPSEGRVLLSKSQLVLAMTENEKETIPLGSVFDVTIDSTPTFVDPPPGVPVTVAFKSAGKRSTAVVSAEKRQSRTFRVVLFKAILNGTNATLKHPAQVGGRVLDTPFEGGILSLQAASVQFDTEEGPVSIPLDSVVDFSREARTVDGIERPVLVVSHMDNGEALTTLAAIESNRKLSLLGRYLRQTYQTVVDSLQNLKLSEPETETLTTLYSVGDMDVSLPSVLDTDPTAVKRLLHALHEKELIESGNEGPVLTAKGQIVVNEYLERVNE